MGQTRTKEVVLGWLVAGTLAFAIVILFLLLKIPGQGNPMVDALAIPVGVSVLLIIAGAAIVWGIEVGTEDTYAMGSTMVSVDALRSTSREIGFGIITGLVAGSVLTYAQRLHDYARKAR